ncbi:MAG: hypothetical protein BIFFINMI_01339 [Phycisphaerae bacterium]|nr:hypothetical protein [Phycisphaerae bacterium]
MNVTQTTAQAGGDPLRQKIDEFLGLFFYGTMMKEARESRLTDTKLGYGGKAEKNFAAQLDLMLSQRMGQASHNSLGETLYKQLSGYRPRVK